MAKKRNPVEAAAERIAILREIVARERTRAEANPDARRNVELGITEQDQPADEARARIAEVFNELGYLVDHLNVAHMAASFESAALARMANIIGEARSAIDKSRKGSDRWPSNLVRRITTFEGLYDLSEVMALDAETQEIFSVIRKVRNRFSHSPQIDAPPAVTGDETLATLSDMLARFK